MEANGRVSLRELREEWTYDDLMKAAALFALQEEVQLAVEGLAPDPPAGG
jgi:hypothetical protein